jgi:hypothetical protein
LHSWGVTDCPAALEQGRAVTDTGYPDVRDPPGRLRSRGDLRAGDARNVQYGTVNEQVFHFPIEAADANTGRGTLIVGIITAGIVRVADSLDLHHAGSTRAVSCRGVEFVDDLRRSRQLPPLFGLLIPDLEPADVSAGDELTSPSLSD